MLEDYSVQILGRHELGRDVFLLELSAPALAREIRPGQFVLVSVVTGGRDPLLRRPFGYLTRDCKAGRISLLIRAVGRGTSMLRARRPGEHLKVLGPLGRGFTTPARGPVLLVAGGMGLVPLFDLAVMLAPAMPVTFAYGARSAADLHLLDELRGLPLDLYLATDDGGAGRRGTVLDALDAIGLSSHAFYYACGPRPMLAALQRLSARAGMSGEIALEERMACGFGACLGCVTPVRGPAGELVYRRVCVDGPVFSAAEVILDV